MFDETWFATRLLFLIPVVLSLSVHEWAHAWCAWKLGDDTAQRLGRLTLNPLAHMDPMGTLLLPLLGVPFGWAKPVPINPTRFSRRVSMRTGTMLTAAAGPLSNLLLAAICIALVMTLQTLSPESIAPGSPLHALLLMGVFLNVALALFNLLPIPPLDGGRVVEGLIPYRFRPTWDRLSAFAPILLVAIIVGLVLLGDTLAPVAQLQAAFASLLG